MPSSSAKQAKFMRAVAHSPKFAKKVGVSQSVGKDFEMADKKMKKFGDGGMTAKKPRPFNDPDAERIPTKAEATKLMQPTAPKKPKPDPDTLGMKKMAKGGKAFRAKAPKGASAKTMMPSASGRRPISSLASSPSRRDVSAIRGDMDTGSGMSMPPEFAKGGKGMKGDKAGRAMTKKSADTMGRAMMNKGGKCYAKGGSASARADGIAQKGKTKGRMLAKGGKAKKDMC